jgi:GlcNAc-P-P-Und epimerase
MNLLFTGASGFLGHNIRPILAQDYRIKTIGLYEQDDFLVDISNTIPKLTEKFDIVLHAAGKAHVLPKNKSDNNLFFSTNLQGTINLCKALERSGLPESLIFISSVAVYGLDYGTDITEDAPLKGNTAYALSKIQAELFLGDWCLKNGVKLSILRPSLIAGEKPVGNLGAMIKGIKSGTYFRIGNGGAKKSVLMAKDIALIIPKLVKIGGIYNLCDNHHPSFAELEELISKQLNIKRPRTIPYFAAKSMALVGDIIGSKFPVNSDKLDKMTKSLTFSNQKAKRALDWEPLDVLVNFKVK